MSEKLSILLLSSDCARSIPITEAKHVFHCSFNPLICSGFAWLQHGRDFIRMCSRLLGRPNQRSRTRTALQPRPIIAQNKHNNLEYSPELIVKSAACISLRRRHFVFMCALPHAHTVSLPTPRTRHTCPRLLHGQRLPFLQKLQRNPIWVFHKRHATITRGAQNSHAIVLQVLA